MNTPRIAWQTLLAPDADPGDGWLDLVLVRQGDRLGLAGYLPSVLANHLADHPNVSMRRARRIDLVCHGAVLHADEEVRQAGGGARLHISVSVLTQAVDVWIPAPAAAPVLATRRT
jgi:diacylglycerol kinase family enzyme